MSQKEDGSLCGMEGVGPTFRSASLYVWLDREGMVEQDAGWSAASAQLDVMEVREYTPPLRVEVFWVLSFVNVCLPFAVTSTMLSDDKSKNHRH
jgi:hypothetical protein